MTKQVVDWMREVGFQSINIDLIYGLPFQTPESFARTLDECCRWSRTASRCSTTRTCRG